MREPALSYLRKQVGLPGENFVAQWNTLTDKDKADMKAWAEAEMDVLYPKVAA